MWFKPRFHLIFHPSLPFLLFQIILFTTAIAFEEIPSNHQHRDSVLCILVYYEKASARLSGPCHQPLTRIGPAQLGRSWIPSILPHQLLECRCFVWRVILEYWKVLKAGRLVVVGRTTSLSPWSKFKHLRYVCKDRRFLLYFVSRLPVSLSLSERVIINVELVPRFAV